MKSFREIRGKLKKKNIEGILKKIKTEILKCLKEVSEDDEGALGRLEDNYLMIISKCSFTRDTSKVLCRSATLHMW